MRKWFFGLFGGAWLLIFLINIVLFLALTVGVVWGVLWLIQHVH